MSTNEVSFLNDNGAWSHHAFGVEGEPTSSVPWIQNQLTLGADLSIYSSEQLDIETVREVRSRSGEVGFQGVRAFILAGYRYTTEAQNALLKITEEPIVGTAFFLVVPRISHLLPTLRSRLRSIQAPHAESFSNEVSEFLRAPLPARLKILEKLLEGHDEHGEKRIAAERFDRFTRELAEALREKRPTKPNFHPEQEILFVREYIYDTAASLKLLGDHLALSLPRS